MSKFATKAAAKFPSPVGELHFSMGKTVSYILDNVSVPCRGTTFLNLLVNLNKIRRITRFRPLSGNYISQWAVDVLSSKAFCLFPSPVGELHFSIMVSEAVGNCIYVSVPCRGTTFLNKRLRIAVFLLWYVSVPCRGTTFLNRKIIYENI